MSQDPIFATAGSEAEKIDVRLSYRIVRLFSEGLYVSPNKAIEELIANSFDAGARRVAVFLAAEFHDQGATIATVDDGEGMDAGGLKQHWLIGKSDKRDLAKLPLGRRQIGKFGIGKLATYVLANCLEDVEDDEPTVPCPYCHRKIHEDSQCCPYCEQYISREDAPRTQSPGG